VTHHPAQSGADLVAESLARPLRERIAVLEDALQTTASNLRTLAAASPGWRGHGAWLAVVDAALGDRGALSHTPEDGPCS
jgi:hypothetical protein